jgi:hypothetical protein
MNKLFTTTTGLLLAILLTACSKPEPQTIVTFSCEGGELDYTFNMKGTVSAQPLDASSTNHMKVRFAITEKEWVDFTIDKEKKTLAYQANFSAEPNYQIVFSTANYQHNFWQGDDPDTQSQLKLLNAPRQFGIFYWR